MEESEEEATSANAVAEALDVEFLPLVIAHKIHRNLRSSQVEVVPQNYYVREPTPEEIEVQGEMEPEPKPPQVVYAPPLPALKEVKNWWDFVRPVYAFNNPRIRERIELLMVSRIVHVTDRKYMVRLQERIKDDYAACLKKRMSERAADEIEREKRLLLQGKISYEEAPAELKNHPVCRINQLAQLIIRHKKAKMKKKDKTFAYKTSRARIRMMQKKLKEAFAEIDAERYLEATQHSSSTVCVLDGTPSEEIEMGLMFSKEDYEKLRSEDPLIKLLREIDAVNEMYALADQIIGATHVEVKSK